jgi:nodulation protein E
MSPARRIAITGIGTISCLGRGRAETLESGVRGRVGIKAIECIDASRLLCRIAGEVPAAALAEDFKEYDRFTRFALIAASEAAEQANLADPSIDRTRLATLIGTALGGNETLDASYERLYGKNLTRLSPFTIPRIMYNAATSAVSAHLRALGPAYSIASACASATHSIGQAFHWLRSGMADLALAGGSDAPLTVGTIRCWESLRVLAPTNGAPEAACRPFSSDRQGLVLAEGAAVFVLETFESALRRGRTILGEIVGCGLSSDAGHLTDPTVEGPARALQAALDDAQLTAQQVDYINAHGTATRANDPIESAAIRRVLGSRADKIPVSSTKSMHGHAMGASGAIELAVSLLCLNEGWVPPTMNYTIPDPECDLDYVPNQARQGLVGTFLSNSFGFGGVNGVLAVRTRHAL